MLFHVLPFTDATMIIPLPQRIGQVLTMGSLGVAFPHIGMIRSTRERRLLSQRRKVNCHRERNQLKGRLPRAPRCPAESDSSGQRQKSVERCLRAATAISQMPQQLGLQ